MSGPAVTVIRDAVCGFPITQVAAGLFAACAGAGAGAKRGAGARRGCAGRSCFLPKAISVSPSFRVAPTGIAPFSTPSAKSFAKDPARAQTASSDDRVFNESDRERRIGRDLFNSQGSLYE